MTENTAQTVVPVPARSYSSRFIALRRWLAAFLYRPGAAPRRAARLGVEACEDRTVPSITLTAFLASNSITAGQTTAISGSVLTTSAMSTLVVSYDWNAVHFDATDAPITTNTMTFSPPNTLEALGESHEYDTPGDYTIDVKATATYPDASTETADQTFTVHVASASGGMSGGSGGTSGGSGGTNPAAVWLGPTAQTIAEGSSGDVWVYRSGGDTTQPLAVNLGLGTDGSLDPLAAWGTDYTLSGPSGGSGGSSASLSGSGGTVTFGANQTAVDLGVAALSDALTEGTEGFRVTVQTGTGYTPGGASGGMAGGSTTADVQITDPGTSGGMSGGSGDTSPVATTTALSASPNPATYGQAVTLCATVSSSASGGATPTGDVTFWDGMSYLGTGTLTSGTATLTYTGLGAGLHSLLAIYGGDANDTGSSGSAGETITPATLTVTAGNATKVYDQANPSLTAAVTGFVNGDGPGTITGTPSLTTPATTASGVGSYPITAAPGSLSASNYAFAFVGGTLSVTPAALSVTAAAQTKVYGATDPAFTYTPTGLVNGDTSGVFSGSLTRAAGPNVGTYAITQGTLSAGPNYTLGFTAASLTITPAALTITGLTASSKTYDGTTAATLDVSAAGLQGMIVPEDVTLVTTSATGVFAAPNAGSGVAVTASGFTLTGPAAGNYTLTQPTGLSADITPAALTVRATNQSRTYGFGGPSSLGTTGFGVTTGILYGADSLTGVDLSTDATVSGSGNLIAGTWALTPGMASGTGLSNYAIAYQPGTLTIDPKPVGISGFSVASKVYDSTTGATVTGTGLIAGAVPGDAVVVDTANGLTRFTDPNAGTGKALSISGYALGGADAGDYTLTGQPTAAADITPAVLTITATDQTRAYGFGGTSAALGTAGFTITAGGLSGTDTVTGVTLTTAAPASGSGQYAAGTHDLTPSAATGTGLSNYTITYQPGTLTVNPLVVSVTGFAVADKVYDGTTAATITRDGTLSGNLPGDDVSLNPANASAAFDDPTVGTGKPVTGAGFALSGGDALDYRLTQPTAAADITRTATGTVYYWADLQLDQQAATVADWLVGGPSPAAGGVVATQLPGAGDSVVFIAAATSDPCQGFTGPAAGGYNEIDVDPSYGGTITLAGAVTTGILALQGGTISQPVAGADLTVTGVVTGSVPYPSPASFFWTGGVLNDSANPANLSVQGTTAQIVPAGAGTVTTGDTLNFGGGAVATIKPGTVHITGGTGINIDDASECALAPDPAKPKLTIQAESTSAGYLIKNFGHFLVEGAPGGEASSDIPIEVASGVLDVQNQATMTFKGQQYSFVLGAFNPVPVGSIWQSANTGQIRIAGGATLNAQNGTTMSAGKLTVDIAGNLGGGNDPSRTGYLGGNLTVTGGFIGAAYDDLKATGAGVRLVVVGSVFWSGGTFRTSVDPGTGDCTQWTSTDKFVISNSPSLDVLPSDNTAAFAGPFTPIRAANGITGAVTVETGYTWGLSDDKTYIEVTKKL